MLVPTKFGCNFLKFLFGVYIFGKGHFGVIRCTCIKRPERLKWLVIEPNELGYRPRGY